MAAFGVLRMFFNLTNDRIVPQVGNLAGILPDALMLVLEVP